MQSIVEVVLCKVCAGTCVSWTTTGLCRRKVPTRNVQDDRGPSSFDHWETRNITFVYNCLLITNGSCHTFLDGSFESELKLIVKFKF